MTKNTIGGKGHKRSKAINVSARPLQMRDSETDYAYVLDVLGGGRMRVFCYSDSKERIGHIRGSLYKKVWIARDDLVLVSFRDFEQGKCDILLKYTPDEARLLIRRGHLPENFAKLARKEEGGNNDLDADADIMFEDNDNKEINIDEI
ncbi:MAG: hypothetical protein EBU90_04100 [Proteobacteria bacterium]|nr:hypothetical protein [Pseudomonadota bacterium]NBP13925.1 hypothetical protein [bacterium]